MTRIGVLAVCLVLMIAAVATVPLQSSAQPAVSPSPALQVRGLISEARANLQTGNVTGAKAAIEQALAKIASTFKPNSPELAEANEIRASVSAVLKDAGATSDGIAKAMTTWATIFGTNHPSLRFPYRRLAKVASSAEAAGLKLTWPESGLFGPKSGPLSSNFSKLAEFLTAKAQDPASEQIITTKGPGSTDEPFERMPVFYGTTRKLEDSEDPYNAYGSTRAPLSFGVVTVSIPDTHELGNIEAPSLIRLEFRPDPNKHIVLWDIKPLPPGEFRTRLQDRVAKSSRKEAFVFIHGYNTTFGEAAMRTAQMAFDLEVDGPAVMYSWPARGGVLGTVSYAGDSNECNAAAFPPLADFLTEVASQSGARTVNVLAHSMGNCFLTQAMTLLADRGKTNLLKSVVFAAPDVDSDAFKTLLPKISRVSKDLTLYSSANDFALRISQQVNGGVPRAGQPEARFAAAEVVSVDASAAPAPDDVGHSYFAGGALGDVRAVIWQSLSPAKRCVLKRISEGALSRWLLSTTACDDKVFRLAILLMRRSGPNARNVALRQQAALASAGKAELAALFGGAAAEIERISR